MNSIFLIGFMGAGKTTAGKELGKSMGLPVYDTDAEIQKETGSSISKIFETIGEDGFRTLETKMLFRMPVNDAIITTGGGIVLNKDNRSWLKQNGTVIFLKATPEQVVNRLSEDYTRPLLGKDKVDKIYELMEARYPLYVEASHFQIETSGKSIQEVAKEIEACLGR